MGTMSEVRRWRSVFADLCRVSLGDGVGLRVSCSAGYLRGGKGSELGIRFRRSCCFAQFLSCLQPDYLLVGFQYEIGG